MEIGRSREPTACLLSTISPPPLLSVFGRRLNDENGHRVEHGKCVRPRMQPIQEESRKKVIFRTEVAATTIPSDEALLVARHDNKELSSGCEVILTRVHQMRLAEARVILDCNQNLNFMEVELRERTDIPFKAEMVADSPTARRARYPESAGQGPYVILCLRIWACLAQARSRSSRTRRRKNALVL